MTCLEGDGPNPDIYHLIWQNDGPFVEKAEISIPDTVVFLHGIPINWYFTSQDGRVLKKKVKNLTLEKIIEKFTSKSSPDDIVAYFIHMDSEKLQQRLFLRKNSKMSIQESPDSSRCFIEYYTADEFIKEFSNASNCQKKTGILQYFIQPFGAHNDVIQAVWTPNLCVFTKKVNFKRLNNTKLQSHEKASTFDGPEFCSRSIPVKGKHIPAKLRTICESLANHISNISYEKIVIQKLVAYFKVDENEKVFFLWAGSVRVKEDKELKQRSSSYKDKSISLEPGVQNIEFQGNKRGQRASSCLTKNYHCVTCSVTSKNLVPIMYKMLIRNEQVEQSNYHSASSSIVSNQLQEQSLKDVNSRTEIPMFLKKLYPKLRLKDYLSLSQQETFLMQKTQVCEDCFIEATRNYENILKANLDVSQKIMRLPSRPVSQERSESSQRALRLRAYQSSSRNTISDRNTANKTVDIVSSQPDPKIQSESQLNTNRSQSTRDSTITAGLKLKMSLLLLKRKENYSSLEKSSACRTSLNQNSSPARLKNPMINDQLNSQMERYSQNLSSLSVIKDKFEPSSRNSSIITRASLLPPRNKPRSLNFINNVSSSRLYQSQSRNEIKDIDDLLNESSDNTAVLEPKQHDDQSEATTNYQSSLRERYSRNGSHLLDIKDLPVQKSFEIRHLPIPQIQSEAENYSSLTQSMRKDTSGTCGQDPSLFVKNFSLKPRFKISPAKDASFSSSHFLQHQRSSIKIKPETESIEFKRNYASTRGERRSDLELDITNDEEKLQKSVVIEKLYKTRINTAHRAKSKRI